MKQQMGLKTGLSAVSAPRLVPSFIRLGFRRHTYGMIQLPGTEHDTVVACVPLTALNILILFSRGFSETLLLDLQL